MKYYLTLSLVSCLDRVIRDLPFSMSFCKRRYLFLRSVFLIYLYLMVGLKFSLVINILIFLRLLPHFFADTGGPSQCLYSGL